MPKGTKKKLANREARQGTATTGAIKMAGPSKPIETKKISDVASEASTRASILSSAVSTKPKAIQKVDEVEQKRQPKSGEVFTAKVIQAISGGYLMTLGEAGRTTLEKRHMLNQRNLQVNQAVTVKITCVDKTKVECAERPAGTPTVNERELNRTPPKAVAGPAEGTKLTGGTVKMTLPFGGGDLVEFDGGVKCVLAPKEAFPPRPMTNGTKVESAIVIAPATKTAITAISERRAIPLPRQPTSEQVFKRPEIFTGYITKKSEKGLTVDVGSCEGFIPYEHQRKYLNYLYGEKLAVRVISKSPLLLTDVM